ncbi:hypothetical protein BK146_04510, partial [Paenibacillus sp. FSL R7-0333]
MELIIQEFEQIRKAEGYILVKPDVWGGLCWDGKGNWAGSDVLWGTGVGVAESIGAGKQAGIRISGGGGSGEQGSKCHDNRGLWIRGRGWMITITGGVG